MKNRVLGVIGILWGGGIVAHWLLAGPSAVGSGAYAAGYQTGQCIGLGLGIAMCAAGLYAILRKTE